MVRPQQGLSVGHGAQNKSNTVAGGQLCSKREIGRNYDRNLGIASGGLPVCHQEDRLPVRGDLQGSHGSTVGDELIRVFSSDLRSGQAIAHAIGLRSDGIGGFRQGRDRMFGKEIMLWTRKDVQGDGAFIVRA